MPQPCKVCLHPDRAEIDALVVSGEPNQRIATKFGLTESGVRRHKASHLPKTLAKAAEAKEVARADNLMNDVQAGEDRAERLYIKAEEILTRAVEAQELRTAIAGVRAAVGVLQEARQHKELRGKLSGELDKERVSGMIIILPERFPPGSLPGSPALDSEGAVRKALGSGQGRIVNTTCTQAADICNVEAAEIPGPG